MSCAAASQGEFRSASIDLLIILTTTSKISNHIEGDNRDQQVSDSHTNISDSHTNISDSHTNISDSHTNISDSHTNISDSHTNISESHTTSWRATYLKLHLSDHAVTSEVALEPTCHQRAQSSGSTRQG